MEYGIIKLDYVNKLIAFQSQILFGLFDNTKTFCLEKEIFFLN